MERDRSLSTEDLATGVGESMWLTFPADARTGFSDPMSR